MNLSLALVESDVRPCLAAIFARVGLQPTGRGDSDLCGIEVWQAMERLTQDANRPCTYVWVGYEHGWTALADESGHLAGQSQTWRELAQELGKRVLVLLVDADDQATGFAVYFPDGTRRTVLRCHGEVETRGQKMAIEHCFDERALSRDHLLLVAQTLGVDVERLNAGTRYQLWETATSLKENWL